MDDVVVAVAAYYGARRPKHSAGIRRLSGHVYCRVRVGFERLPSLMKI